RYFDEFSAAQSQRVLFFLALGFRNDDEGPVTPRFRNQRKADARIARGAFQNETTWLKVAALLGFQDHLLARAILHRLAGIHELCFAENGATGLLGSSLQL